jgi:hypothetical protein
MALEFVGIDPVTDRDHCPVVWTDSDAGEVVIQGWKASAEMESLCEATSPANGPIPNTEAVVRIPARMAPILRKALDAVERPELR